MAKQDPRNPYALKFGRTLKRKIHDKEYREKLYRKYGAKAFLMPEQKKFPVVNPNTGKISCKLLKAAKIRAAQHGYTQVVSRAAALLQRNGCLASIGK